VTRIQVRRGNAAAWTAANPVLSQGEFGYELDTGKLKVGDGSTAWNVLSYFPVEWSALNGAPAFIAAGESKAAARAVISAASLDANGKVPGSELPNSIMTYEGLHDVSTNSPEISDATGTAGQVYRVSVAGTRDYGSGSIELGVGDYLIHSGTAFEKADTTDAVSTVAGRTGNIVLTTADVDGAVSLTGSETLTGKTLTAPTVNGGTLNEITVNGVTEGVTALGTVFGVVTLPPGGSTIFTATLTASTETTFSMPNAAAGRSCTLILRQAAVTGAGTAVFTGVLWPDGEAYAATSDAGAVDMLTFVSDGTDWFGASAGGFA